MLILSLILSCFISFHFVTPVIAKFQKNNLNNYYQNDDKPENNIYQNIENTTDNEFFQYVTNEQNLKSNKDLKVLESEKDSEDLKISKVEEDDLNVEAPNAIMQGKWRLIIKKIQLDAEVKEGTSEEILNQYIGHFENTSILQGTVGLCAHNRGYEVNYFERLNELKVGDEVQYITEIGTKNYSVIEHEIIKNDDWSYFTQEESKNKLILITCVENEPDLRRIVICLENNGT